MARLPDASNLGPMPAAASGRPVAGADVSAYGRGADAMTRAGLQLGASVSNFGKAIGEGLEADDKLAEAKAQSKYLTETRRIATDLDAETEPGDLDAKYRPQFEKVRDDALSGIANPRRRELFKARLDEDVEKQVLRAGAVNTKLRNDKDYAEAENQLGMLWQSAQAESDEFRRAEYVRAGSNLIDGLVDRGILTNQQALARKQKFVKEYTQADALARIDRGEAEQLLEELRSSRDAMPKPVTEGGPASGPAAAVNRVGENLGLSPRVIAAVISYETGGTFNHNRWGGKGGRHFGAIQFGPEERAKYGVTQNMTFEQQMDAVESYLRDRGAKPGMGVAEIYSIVNAGSLDRNGQPRWDAHDGNGTVREHVAKIEREHLPKADRFLGVTQVAQTTGTVSDAAPERRAPNKYDMLDPLQREQLIRTAETAIRKDQTMARAAFQARVQDTRTEAFNNGIAAKPVTRDEFIAHAGPEAGAAAFEQYQADLTLGADLKRVAALSPAEQDELVASYTPQPGSENYTAQLKRQGEIAKAIGQVRNELFGKDADPALFAIRNLPAAGDSYKALQSTLSDMTATPEQKRTAARNFALVMDAEQARIGVPPDRRRLVPKGYVDALIKNLEQPTGADGKPATTMDAARALQAEASLWGERWPVIARDIQGKATRPVVRVLAAGVDDQAAMALPSLINVSVKDILKGDPDAKEKQIVSEVGRTLTKFQASLLGTRQENEIVRDYAAAAEKLAAHYTQGGKSASEAAELAFQGVLAHKYEFIEGGLFGPWSSARGTVRVPKDAGVPVEKITAGANEARQRLGELGVAPATSGDKALDNDYLQRAAVRGLQRDGVWATAPGDAGLILVHNGKVATKADGSPLVLSWQQLGQMADERTAATRAVRTDGIRLLDRLQ